MKRLGLVIAGNFLFAAILFGGTLYGWWRRALAPADDPGAFLRAAQALIDAGNRANTALVLIENGVVVGELYSTGADAIDGNTVFETASMSKWIAAHAVMKLVEQGKLDLDRPVDDTLTRWHLPKSAFDSREVTARRLLSHTAGLADDLGFGDYALDETVPTLEESLAAPRGSSGTAPPIAVAMAPGSQFRYSGGGYLLLELLVEEISGQPFDRFVTTEILMPLGMERSGYADLSTMTNSAKSYAGSGQPAPIYRYASKAATGFHTSANDLVKLVLAHLQPTEGRPLASTTLESMRRVEAESMGIGIWGLGTILYAPTERDDFVFGHDGVNSPAISATVRINPTTRDAIIVLATGTKTLASQIGAEWVFWQTGLPDVLTIPNAIRSVIPVFGAGTCVIVLLAIASAWRKRRSRAEVRAQSQSTVG